MILLHFVCLFLTAGAEPKILLPAEIADSVRKDLSLEKVRDVEFTPRAVELVMIKTKGEKALKIFPHKPLFDFAAHYGPKEEVQLQFRGWEKKEEPHDDGGGSSAPTTVSRRMYWINRYQPIAVEKSPQKRGLNCDQTLIFDAQMDQVLSGAGLVTKTDDGQHLDLWGGDLFLIEKTKDKVFLGYIQMRDSRYAQRLCKARL